MGQNTPELDRLVERCRHQDNEAWAELVRQFTHQVALWLARFDYTLREQDIADLSQMVFKKLCQTLPTYQTEKSFRAWLYQLTESIAIDHLRRRSAVKRKCPGEMASLHTRESEGQCSIDPPDPSPDPSEDAAQRDEHRLLFEALARLGPPESRCRQLIKLVYFAGFTYDEAGQTMDMKPKTVGAALSRCLDQLQEIASNVFSRGKIAGTEAEP